MLQSLQEKLRRPQTHRSIARCGAVAARVRQALRGQHDSVHLPVDGICISVPENDFGAAMSFLSMTCSRLVGPLE
jgi:hypothetical protein